MKTDMAYAYSFAEAKADYGRKRSGAKRAPRMAERELPRERMAERGPGALSGAELLAVILNTGTKGKNVAELAREIMALLDGNKEIPDLKDLARVSGMGNTKACAIAAMLEFGRRRWGAAGCAIRQPSDVFALLRHNADRKQECFISVSLNGAHEVLASRVVTVGLVNRTIVHPREVFADLIQDRASAFVVAHNHPSGKLIPSPEDDEITERLERAARILGLHFLDHLIFSQSDFYSYRNSGKLDPPLEEQGDDGFQSKLMTLLERL
ncbi:MAG: DNA repair protein RadC [Treponema sp.]|nr:DNA repair protein RadC [Treponema sp.]